MTLQPDTDQVQTDIHTHTQTDTHREGEIYREWVCQTFSYPRLL